MSEEKCIEDTSYLNVLAQSIRTTFLNFLFEDMELSKFPDLKIKAFLCES